MNIRERRERLNISLRKLSKQAKISLIGLHKIETGKTKNPGILTIDKINTALDFFESVTGCSPSSISSPSSLDGGNS
jgi:transcriptional regulator with XRE-family HTH domain